MTSVDITDFCLPATAHSTQSWKRDCRGNEAQGFDRVRKKSAKKKVYGERMGRIDIRAVVAIHATMDPSSKYGNSKYE